MSIVYLNGSYLPMSEARISPMDRGFLFGDGIYEVVPSYSGRMVGFRPHIERLETGLAALELPSPLTETQWREIAETLMERNGRDNLGIYLHVSRGSYPVRTHGYPEAIAPTVYAYTFTIPPEPEPDPASARRYRVITARDERWERCHIKSIALLGNVMHYRQGQLRGMDEVILFNDREEITEAAACNVFAVVDGIVVTPPLDTQKLPGITRAIALDILRRDGSIPVAERTLTLAQLQYASEVWLSSSTKELGPVVEVDGKVVAGGAPGPVWAAAQRLFSRDKYNY